MKCHYPDLGNASDWSHWRFNQLEALPNLGKDTSSVWNFNLRLFLRHHFTGEPVVALQNVGCFLSLSKLWLLVRLAWWLFLFYCFRVWHWTVLKSHCQEYLSMDKHMSPFHEQEACKDSEFWTLTASVWELILMSYVIMQGYREIQNWCNAIVRMKTKRTSALRRKNPAKDSK